MIWFCVIDKYHTSLLPDLIKAVKVRRTNIEI